MFIGVCIIYTTGWIFHINIFLRQLNIVFRLREISEETTIPTVQPRRRSNSLPIPQIEISLYQGTNSRDSPSNSSLFKDYIDVPEQASATLLAG